MNQIILNLYNTWKNYQLKTHVVISFFIHVILIIIAEIQDYYLEVKYTDIDYVVFTDGARYLYNYQSPFNRETYRYTPLLALLMTPNVFLFPQFGKLLFSLFDIVGGCLLYKILNFNSKSDHHLLWLYNPFTLIISTRGSAESMICTFVILVLFYFIKRKYILSGLCFGFVIHFKIYPIIYATTFYLALSKTSSWHDLLTINFNKFNYIVSTLIGLIVPTHISYWYCGTIYIEEAWLYHFHRQDLQHNFSPYFYIYQFTFDELSKRIIAFLAFIPQLTFIILVAFYYNLLPKKNVNIFMALFLQTFLFVTLNKVITAQYFEWYICLLPLIVSSLDIDPFGWLKIFILWTFSIFQWLLPAYLFEFKKWNCLHWLGCSSFLYLFINLSIIVYFHSKFKNKIKL